MKIALNIIKLTICCGLVLTASCTKEYGKTPTTIVYIEPLLTKLALPEGIQVQYQNTVLTMNDRNRWQEIRSFSIEHINDPLRIPASAYTQIKLKTTVVYNYQEQQVELNAESYATKGQGQSLSIYGDQSLLQFELEKK